MNTIKLNLGLSLISITLLSLIACNGVPPTPIEIPTELPETKITQTSHQQEPFIRRVDTPFYSGYPAIIFRLDNVAQGQNEETLEQIIRLFGKYNIPLDVGVIPHADGQDSFEIPLLKRYLDAGIIDLSIFANQYMDKEFDNSQSGTNYEELKGNLTKARNQIEQYFGINPIAITISYDSFNEEGYEAAQDAGFKIFSAPKAIEFNPTVFPVDYSGERNTQGMSRLCTVSDVAHWDATKKEWGDILSIGPDSELSQAIQWGLTNLDVAIVGIHPAAFLNKDNSTDQEKLGQLENIIKSAKELATITTFTQWYQFADDMAIIGPLPVRTKETPAYRGGPAVIFRMDDADRSYLEDTVQSIIQIFEENNVPVDVGVEPYAGNRRSYYMPFLLKYLDAGVIDISVHGYRNTFMEFDTDRSGATFAELDENLQRCFVDAYGQSTFNPTKTNYEQLNSSLLAARKQFKSYFGITPVSFTCPNDLFNEDGYNAVQDAGFKIFSSQILSEPHPNTEALIDFSGQYDQNGMYRIPSVIDLAEWNSEICNWGKILTLTGPLDDVHYSIEWAQNDPRLGIAVISIHPQAFVDTNNKPDPEKMEKLRTTVNYIANHKTVYGEIITFQSWYNYISAKNNQN